MTLISRARRRPLLFAAFACALALTLFFAVRLVLFSIYWADPKHREQPIAGWMTPGFVAHSWHVPREVMLDLLGPPPEGAPKRPTLDDIAAERGVPVEDLIAEIEAAIAAHRAAHD